MAERAKRKTIWMTMTHLERAALVGTILIWIGVFLFAAGLYIAFQQRQSSEQAYAQETVVALTVTQVALPPTKVFPLGWATATVTPLPTATTEPVHTPTPVPLSTNIITAATASTNTVTVITATKSVVATATRAVLPTPTVTPLPPTPENSNPPPSAAPPDRLVISKIDLDSSIISVGWNIIEDNNQQYSIWQVADYVVGWHKTSGYPGHIDNMVLSGHHNIKGEIFRYLVNLEIGDQVQIYAQEQVYYYAVAEKYILKEKGEPIQVRRENAQWIASTSDERLTMVTCWPYTNNTHRLVVVARPVSPPTTD